MPPQRCKNMVCSFITSTTWDVNKGLFGVLPEIWGTLYSSAWPCCSGASSAGHRHFPDAGLLPPKLETVFKILSSC